MTTGRLLAFCLLPMLFALPVRSDEPLTPLRAGQEAYERFESQRQDRVAAQVDLQEYVRWLQGLPDRRLYFSNAAGTGAAWGAADNWPSVWPYSDRLYPDPVQTGPVLRRGSPLVTWWDDGIFEPWPLIPGDIYGFQYDNPIQQPTGYNLSWTGPNGYTYEPVYEDPPADEPPAAPVPGFVPDGTGETHLPAEAVEAFRLGAYDDAVDRLGQELERAPNDGPTHLLYSQALFALGDFVESAAALRRAAELLPEDQWGAIVENYREYYSSGREYTRQLRALEGYTRQNRGNSSARVLLGFHYGYLGYPEAAAAQLARAAAADPRDALARKLLSRFQPQGKAGQGKAGRGESVPPREPARDGGAREL